MTQKIKLMSDDEIHKLSEIFADNTVDGHEDGEGWLDCYVSAKTGATKARDECERVAFEKIKEVAEKFYNCGSLDALKTVYNYENFKKHFQQFLKEQDGE